MRNKLLRHRRASSLVELVITLSAGSTLLALAIGMVHQSMLLSSADTRQTDHQRSLDRLASQFRRDIHLATDWQRESDAQASITLVSGTRVSYQYDRGQMTRIEQQNTQQRRETYSLAPSAVVQLQSLGDPPRAVLSVSVPPPARPPSTDVPLRLDCHVEAIVGRTLALQQAPTPVAEVSP